MMYRSRSIGRRTGRTALLVVVASVVGIVLCGIAYVSFFGSSNGDMANVEAFPQKAERGDFEAVSTTKGEVASSSNVEVRCMVQARGGGGTRIVKICDEGTEVVKDDFIVQFDDSLLQQELLSQKILVANDKAQLIQVQSDLANAERTLLEFDEGTYKVQLELLDGEVFVAEEQLQRAEVSLRFGQRLLALGFITPLQLKAENFSLENAKKLLAVAERKRDVYKRFTREKTTGEYKADIEKQKAGLEAATFTLKLSEQKQAEIEQQISYCLVKAPSAGQVVYANVRKGDTVIAIEEGTVIRETQIVVRIPNLKKMQVDVKINEAYVNRIKPGQPARIELDAIPGTTLIGEVKEVSAYPIPVRWHGAPIEYEIVVTIIDPPDFIQPGLRAKVHIMYESLTDVLQVPVAAVIEHQDRHFCLVRSEQGWQPQLVTIGSNNDQTVIITGGMIEGAEVSLAPFRHIERSDLDFGPSEFAGENKPTPPAVKPEPTRRPARVTPSS